MSRSLRLGVTIDHVATVRNARGGLYPDPVRAAREALEAGADGIMIHSRHKDGEEIREFMRRFREYSAEAPVVLVPTTYNQMSVDLDTSTNDTLIIMASGLAGNPEICEENADYHAFVAALTAIAEHMCAEHAGDGEGATHLITCEVTHAPDLKTARAVSRSVVCSNLFKAAVFGRDANWGRILCAIGYTPGDFSIDKVSVRIASKAGEVFVCENAAYHPFSEDEAYAVLGEHDILVKVDMGTGEASGKAWGCDLT